MDGKINKRGQMVIWIILALVLVASLIIFFTLNRRITVAGTEEFNPQAYVDKCTKEAVNDAVDKMLPQGGFLNPMNYKIYKDTHIPYLCQTLGNYGTCINQHPMLINEMISEIKGYITPRIETCFGDLKNALESRGYTESISPRTVGVSFGPNRIYVNITAKTVMSKNGVSKTINGYEVEIINPIYDLALVAIEIANQESKYCYFEYNGYMMIYQRFNIKKFTMSDSTKIYTITDKHSEKYLNIATRSCAIPAGM